jgi:hypothetical protein
MTKFNLREAIAKNKATFFSSLNENASDTAEKFAKHMSKKENRKFTVTPGSVDEKSFDLDVDGLEYEGGSYLIDDNGDIINVSMGNKVYGNVNQLEEGDLMKSVGKGLEYEAAEEKIRDYADRLLGAGVDDVEDLANFYLNNPEDLPEPMEYEFFKNNFDDILSLAMTGLDEGKKSYYRDAEANDAEHIKALEKDMKDDKMSSKMKMSELKAKIKEQTSQYKKYDKVNYDGEENLIVNILDDGEDENIVLVPMSEIDGEAFSVDSDEISNPKIYSKVNYDGEKHLIVNILKDGDVVLVPMYVIDNEAFSVSKDEIKPSVTENTKMKKSELKAKIKEMILAEMNLDIQDTTSEYDFLAEKKEDTEVEDTEVDIDGMEDIDVDTTSEVDPDIKAVQDLLTQAQAAAQALGDEKLTDQIGNTITFFTRTHVVDKGAVAEELNEAKSLLFSFDYNTDEDNVDYIQGLLKDARVDAIAQPGLESNEMIVKAKNEVELRKAKKVIQANGFKIYKSVVNEAKTSAMSTVIIKELSWIDSTRIIKWLQGNFRNAGGEYEVKETKDTLTIDLSKIALNDRKNFMDYLSSQRYDYVAESLNEATTSWAKLMKGVKSSETGPWSLVAIDNKKVVGQKIDIRTQEIIPAHYEVMRKEFPKAKIHVEDGTGAVVWTSN